MWHADLRPGPRLVCDRDVTKGDYVRICNALSEALHVRVRPLERYEGGIQVCTPTGYKALTHHFNKAPSQGFLAARRRLRGRAIPLGGWPWLPQDAMSAWHGSDELLWAEKQRAWTTLKAFGGAPAWTRSELSIFRRVLRRHGLRLNGMRSAKLGRASK